jgi:hypothetical protein
MEPAKKDWPLGWDQHDLISEFATNLYQITCKALEDISDPALRADLRTLEAITTDWRFVATLTGEPDDTICNSDKCRLLYRMLLKAQDRLADNDTDHNQAKVNGLTLLLWHQKWSYNHVEYARLNIRVRTKHRSNPDHLRNQLLALKNSKRKAA